MKYTVIGKVNDDSYIIKHNRSYYKYRIPFVDINKYKILSIKKDIYDNYLIHVIDGKRKVLVNSYRKEIERWEVLQLLI